MSDYRNTDDAQALDVLDALAWCFASWQPEVRVVGNVRAGDALRAIREAHEAIAAWNRRAPSAEETRLRAEVGSLRAALGKQPAAEGEEPVGCPIPGMCAAVAAHACAARAAAEAMRERAAAHVDCRCSGRADALAATNKGERFVACGNDPCGAIEARAIRALPLPLPGEEG